MRLKELRLRNFRCYQEELRVTFDDFTTIVGRNDAGKSTILDALDIFLNDGAPDKHDASKHGNAADVSITGVFVDLPEQVVLDEDAFTTFGNELLLDQDGQLVVEKVFNGNLEKPKVTAIRVHAQHPTAQHVRDLLGLTNAQLKARARELGVDVATVDQTSNASLRQGIRQTVGELRLAPMPVVLGDGNGAKVWKGIQAVTPAFALFKSDRASTDQDPEAQDPMMAAVREAVRQKEAELNAITAHVEQEVRKIASLTLKKLQEMDPTLAATLTPQISVPKWHSQFKASITGDDDIPINKRGSGVRRLVLLNFFRAKAEQLLRERPHVIYAIEEPEASQHPRNQRLLMSAFQQLSLKHQVIITTHTPMLARAVPDHTIRYVCADSGNRTISVGGSPETNRAIAESLGVLPDHSIKLFIAVEGPTDISFLKHLSRVLVDADETVPDLETLELDGHVMFVPLGGSTVGLWSHRLQGFGRPEFHICDRDNHPPLPPKYHKYLAEVNTRDGCLGTATSRREIENYVHHEAINEALSASGIGVTIGCAFGPFDDVGVLIRDQVNMVVPQGRKWGVGGTKEFLCCTAVRHMTKARLEELDPEGEVLGWFTTMQGMLDSVQ